MYLYLRIYRIFMPKIYNRERRDSWEKEMIVWTRELELVVDVSQSWTVNKKI